MTGIYKYSIILIFSFAVLVFAVLFFISAPYGKFSRRGWGPSIKSKWAWMVMESPSPVLMALFFATADNRGLLHFIFLFLWLSHYIPRTFIYSFRQSGRNKEFPLVVAFMAIIFNLLNGTANGFGVFHLYSYDVSWLLSWQFITGILIFLTGFVINQSADEKLRTLRGANNGEYVIPEGWLFNYISCPHYFGEILEWAGWAVMTWSLPGLSFFVFTFANLFPRAIASHKWYLKKFPGYPEQRKAVIPFII